MTALDLLLLSLNFVVGMIADGQIRGLAFDWITTNLYGVGWNGQVFVCIPSSSSTIGWLTCADLLTGQGNLNGIALDPNNG